MPAGCAPGAAGSARLAIARVWPPAPEWTAERVAPRPRPRLPRAPSRAARPGSGGSGGSRVRPGSVAGWPDGASAEGRAQGARRQRDGRTQAPEQVPAARREGESWAAAGRAVGVAGGGCPVGVVCPAVGGAARGVACWGVGGAFHGRRGFPGSVLQSGRGLSRLGGAVVWVGGASRIPPPPAPAVSLAAQSRGGLGRGSRRGRRAPRPKP